MIWSLLAAPALAQDDIAEEIVVWGDLFARWDDTRWLVKTEVGMPFELVFAADMNKELQVREFQVAAVLHCSKDWKLSGKKYEVGCALEDVALQAAVSERNVSEADVERAQGILDEIDRKLTGAILQLQVADDGRVTDLDLEGITTHNRRQNVMQETLRQVVSRMVVGFHMKMQKFNQLHEGKWYEFNSTLMSIPLPPGVPGSSGSSMMVHQLDRYKGHVLVQSVGKGTTEVSGNLFTLAFTGVSIYDDREGFMSERVWALEGTPNASTLFNAAASYFHAGRIAMLGPDDHPDLGPTRPVNGRSQHSPLLPAWQSIEH
ncbi:MAG: hypothetical protein H6738_16920 [Alphaproteobacteria bacterium]|nr:hypothetical protein [Alphaproteobacteria bacterium]MCB9698466.1 hypothetical protein [Alphaproteobacteria bacterium]